MILGADVISKDAAAELLDLIADRAPKLRAAGIQRVALDGFEAELAPAEPEAADDDPRLAEEEQDRGVLDDPATFGRRTGVPGRKSLAEPKRKPRR